MLIVCRNKGLSSQSIDSVSMIRFVLISACIVALASAGVPYHQAKTVADDFESDRTTHYGAVSVDLGGHGSTNLGGQDSKTYASAAQLSSLAHSSALQAKSAVQSQNTAGSQASFNAKSSLAQAALGAAATAQAALVGKQVIVQGLEHQLQDAQRQLELEISQFEHTKTAAQAAQEAAEQSQQQVNALTAALTASQGGAAHAAKAAAEAAGAAAAQLTMIQQAKTRVAYIKHELNHAVTGLEETKAAAETAAAEAQIAQNNVADAANAVAASATTAETDHYKGDHVEHFYSH